MQKISYLLFIMLVMPSVVFGAPKDFSSLVDVVIDLVGTLTTIVFVLTVFAIVWGVIKGWIIQGAEEEGVENGKKVAFVGIIVLVITVSLWGILAILKGSLFG